jgi:hypothetical protein
MMSREVGRESCTCDRGSARGLAPDLQRIREGTACEVMYQRTIRLEECAPINALQVCQPNL